MIRISFLLAFSALALVASAQQLALVDYTAAETNNQYRVEFMAANQRFETFLSDGFTEYDSIVVKDVLPINRDRTGIKYFAYDRKSGQRLLITTAANLKPIKEETVADIQDESQLKGRYVQVGAFSSREHAETYIQQKQLQNTQIVKKEELWKIVIPYQETDYQAVREKVPDAFVTRFD
jgi:hypothetical protein